jgi:hypothetical protein
MVTVTANAAVIDCANKNATGTHHDIIMFIRQFNLGRA